MKFRLGRNRKFKEEYPDFTSIKTLFSIWDELSTQIDDGELKSNVAWPLLPNIKLPSVNGGDNNGIIRIYRRDGQNVVSRHSPRKERFAQFLPKIYFVNDLDATNAQFYTEVEAFRSRVWGNVSQGVRDALDRREPCHIAILAPEEYEFKVAMEAALALGAIVVPMSASWSGNEMLHVVTSCRAVAILVSNGGLRMGLQIEKSIKDVDPFSPFVCIPVPTTPHSISLRSKKPKSKL